jgi:hypothetical protein
MKRLSISLLLTLLLTLIVVTPTFAGGGHIYGVVFMDEDTNGVWGNEPGVADIRVHFVSGDADIVLLSAWNDNDGDEGADMYCSHLDEAHIDVPKGCNGTFGLIEAGGGWWEVYIDVPAGYKLTTPGSKSNPYKVQALGIGGEWTDGTEWIEFGLVPAGAGGRQVPAYTGAYVFRAAELEVAALGFSISGPEKAKAIE